MPYDQSIFSGEQAFPSEGLPRVDISNMRRSDNVEDMRPRSRMEYLYNLLMARAPDMRLAMLAHPFTSPEDARSQQFQQYLAQDRPAQTSDLALQAGAGNVQGFINQNRAMPGSVAGILGQLMQR